MKKLKRLAALLCAVVLMLSLLPAASAAGATVTVGSASAKQGGYLSIYVKATELENLAAMSFNVYYDASALQLNSHTAYGFANASVNTDTTGVVSYDGMSLDGISGSTNLLYLFFRVNADAPVGPYSLTITIGDAYDMALAPTSIASVSGTVTVTEAAVSVPTVTFSAFASASSAEVGQDVEVTVKSSNVRNLAAGNFTFNYDSDVFVFRSLELLTGLQTDSALTSVNSATAGMAVLSYTANAAATSGNLMKLTLTAKAAAEASAISMTASDLYALDLSQLNGSSPSVSVAVTEKTEMPDYPNVWLTAPQTVNGTEAFTASVWLEGSSGLGAADFVVSYDAQTLECTAVETVADSGSMVITNPGFAEGSVKFSFVNSSGITADTEMVRMTFRAKKNAAQELALTVSGSGVVDTEFADVQLEYIPAAVSVQKTLFDLHGVEMAPETSLALTFLVEKELISDGFSAVIVRCYADGRTDVVKSISMSDWTSCSDTLYGIVYDGVDAKGVCDNLSVTIVDAENTAVSNVWTGSLQSCLAEKVAASAGDVYTAALHYGAAAQTHFAYGSDAAAGYEEQIEVLMTAYSDALDACKDESSLGGTQKEVVLGSSCILGNDLQMKLYFASGDIAVLVNGEEASLEQTEGASYQYCTVDIAPGEIFDLVSISVQREGEIVATAQDSVAGYCARLRSIGKTDLANAILLYGLTARSE